MKVKWLGHSSFLITSDSGTKIVTDPYGTVPGLRYGAIKETADIVTASHDHFDHNNAAAVKGNPVVVRGTAKVQGIEFKGVPTYHDETEGKLRGKNTILCFEVDGIRVCHLGDLGHQLGDNKVMELGMVDILLIPVGGYFTIDAMVASQLCNQLTLKVIIPMHYKTDKCDFPIAGVDEFLQGKQDVSRLDTSEAEFKQTELPSSTKIVVLKPAL
jgi:L-ascorbate metabolism protein UlaG (beta-lactamase superfamily)